MMLRHDACEDAILSRDRKSMQRMRHSRFLDVLHMKPDIRDEQCRFSPQN